MVESMRHQPSLKQVATAAMIRLLEARGGRGDGDDGRGDGDGDGGRGDGDGDGSEVCSAVQYSVLQVKGEDRTLSLFNFTSLVPSSETSCL